MGQQKPVSKRIGVAEGKFKIPDEFDKWDKEIEKRILIREKHIYALAGLKRNKDAPSHKDPFDRMLICQASTENMMFITHDSLLPGYNEPCILAV